MKGKIWPPPCLMCGKLMSYRDEWMRFTPYAGSFDWEPPDDEFIHRRCWDGSEEKDRQFWTNVSRLPIRPVADTPYAREGKP